MGIEFQFREVKSSAHLLHNSVNTVNTTKLYT